MVTMYRKVMLARQHATRTLVPEKIGISAMVCATPRILGLAKPMEKPLCRPK